MWPIQMTHLQHVAEKEREKYHYKFLGLHNRTKDSPKFTFLQPTLELGVVA